MSKLSIILPFCNEYPQLGFTVQSILNELKQLEAETELIVIDNFCTEVEKQTIGEDFCPKCMQSFKKFRVKDKGSDFLQKQAKSLSNLKYIVYTEKLSHWNAKNVGVQASTGDILLFLDAHVVPSTNTIKQIFDYYTTHYTGLKGTLHLPLAYLLGAPGSELIYNFVTNPAKGYYHYTFTKYKKAEKPYKVACMSTCGMMISREIYDLLGGWPTEMGIYGGGENFINFCLAVMGFDKWIMPVDPLYHYADERGYYYNYDDFIRNRTIATYMCAGEDAAHRFVKNCQGNLDILEKIYLDAITKTKEHRKLILSNQQISIKEWMNKIKQQGLWNGLISEKQYVS